MLVGYKKLGYRVPIHREVHKDRPHRTSHINLIAPWKDVAKDWGWTQNQTLRFKYIGEIADEDEIVQDGQDPVMMAMFHVC